MSTTPIPVQPSPLIVGELFSFLLPRLEDPNQRQLPAWPPDVFGLMSALIQRSGAYIQALQKWPAPRWSIPSALGYAKWSSNLGGEWKKAYFLDKPAPDMVNSIWNSFIKNAWGIPVQAFSHQQHLAHDALLLLALADEASAGLGTANGLHQAGLFGKENLQFWMQSLYLNQAHPLLFQSELDTSRITILGKRRTPQSGLNVRSLSHNLCAIEGCEVAASWRVDHDLQEKASSMNVLLFPWPFNISPKAFRPVAPAPEEMSNMPNGFGFFTYDPDSSADVYKALEQALEKALQQVDKIHLVVLPECAVNEAEWETLSSLAKKRGFIMIAGVSKPANSDFEAGQNEVKIRGAFSLQASQRKHHRWQLDRSQIVNYQLGSRLEPETRWWEYIGLGNREIIVHQLNSWLCLMPLICEDLARPDPVGEIVRSVGPDLVIALLMDGPQLMTRWTARNAINLADDPGCSVLTLTSLGMIDLSNTRQKNPRIVPALFKDPVNGAHEIEFPAGTHAAVVTLNRSPRNEWTADGRPDEMSNSCPTLGGIRFLKLNLPTNGA